MIRMATTTTIQIETDVREILKGLGSKGETYNHIIMNLIQEHEYHAFMEQQYSILDSETTWIPLDSLE